MRRLMLVSLVLLAITLGSIGSSVADQAVPTPRGQLGGPAPLATATTLPTTPLPTPSPTPEETATPAASPAAPDVPRPEECTVEPRSRDEVERLVKQQAGTPRSLAPGESLLPDPVTTAAIRQAVRLYIACLNAGDLLRAAALSTDAHAAELLATGAGTPASEAAFGTPMPRPEPEWIAIVAIEDIFLHGEDQASAIVVLDEPTALGARSFVRYHVRFAKDAERWLIDAVQLGPTE